MILEHSGWSQERGWFCDKYFFNETKADHEIHWKNGRICKQQSPFQYLTADFNNDGDVYTEFGCWFDSVYAGREWWTPQNLLDVMLEGEAIIPNIRRI